MLHSSQYDGLLDLQTLQLAAVHATIDRNTLLGDMLFNLITTEIQDVDSIEKLIMYL